MGKSLSRWKVRLEGHTFDLNHLAQLDKSDFWSVAKFEDGYFLESPVFEHYYDHHDVYGAATELLEKINGLVRLASSSYEPVKLGNALRRFDDDANKHDQYIILETIETKIRAGSLSKLTVSNPNGTVKEAPRAPTLAEKGFPTALNDENMVDALHYWSTFENSWYNLYKILEIIEADVGGQRELESVDWGGPRVSSEIVRFKRTANNNKVLGYDARHERSPYAPPANPMNLDNAVAFVRKLLHSWIEYKIGILDSTRC